MGGDHWLMRAYSVCTVTTCEMSQRPLFNRRVGLDWISVPNEKPGTGRSGNSIICILMPTSTKIELPVQDLNSYKKEQDCLWMSVSSIISLHKTTSQFYSQSSTFSLLIRASVKMLFSKKPLASALLATATLSIAVSASLDLIEQHLSSRDASAFQPSKEATGKLATPINLGQTSVSPQTVFKLTGQDLHSDLPDKSSSE